tara:strand:- start:118 stop:591 length:474 start_codon:yes stop_codon:yes gene_type:complete
MDFKNGHFLEELNSVRKRIIPVSQSTSSISTDSIELCPPNNVDQDRENNYINLETFNSTRDSIRNSNIEQPSITISNNSSANRHTRFFETNMDSLNNYNLQRTFDRLNKTLELNTSVISENKNNCCQTVTVFVLASAYLFGLFIINDFILLSYFVNN